MVIDTSAPAATFFAEPERTAFVRAITAAASRLISAASVLETGIVLEGRQGENAGREFDLFKSEASNPAPSILDTNPAAAPQYPFLPMLS